MAGAEQSGGAHVGIDLGTTYSALAWVNSQSGHVEVVPNGEGYQTTPSVVYFDEESVVVGREAAKMALLEPDHAAECFKRDMGQPHYSHPVCGEARRPEMLSALVLKKLCQDATEKIGPIAEAVITVPAYFDDARRKATMDAGVMAGLAVRDIINEPSAAALWYGYSRHEHASPGKIFLVYDLGGGTFDATLMRVVKENEFCTLATDGDVMLGGKDWDRRLLDYAATEFMRQFGADPREDPLSFQELAMRVEEGKRTLSKRSHVSLPVSHAGQRLALTVTRAKFEELTADLLGRTRTTLELLLGDAGLTWAKVDRILLVGGSSRMPMVAAMLGQLSGRELDASLDPDLAVSQGAALHAAALACQQVGGAGAAFGSEAARLRGFKHRPVNSHSLGVEIDGDDGQRENFIIIPRNSPLPCAKTASFGLSEASNAESVIAIPVMEGEARNPEACTQIGTCIIGGIPPGLPVGSPVDVTFSYSEDGRIHVRAVAREANCQAQTQIERSQGLSQKDIGEQAITIARLQVS